MGRRLGTIAIASALSVSVWTSLSVDARQAVECSRAWVGHERTAEAFLKTAEIARVEDLPIGVTRPKRAFFRPTGPVRSVAWKPLPSGMRHGYWESYKSEIAAYELDKVLALHMVPPVVERTIDTQVGAVVWWLEPVKGWKQDSPARGPEPEWSRQVSRMKLFDQLIANIDRNQGNLLYDPDWHLLLIDHSRAFTNRRTLDGVAAPVAIDRALWKRMDALTLADLTPALAPWIGKDEIQAILVRRDRMRRDIARMVRSKGEARVFIN